MHQVKPPQISANGTVYFVNSFDQGLVAAMNSATKSLLYYGFDGLGYDMHDNDANRYHYDMNFRSVVSILDGNGRTQNTYQYDPFGRIIQQTEQVRNVHKYMGSLGVIADEELQHIYMMRDRHYDAQHGRFISMDPVGKKKLDCLSVPYNEVPIIILHAGLSGRNPNLYVYAFNTPLLIRDPTGQIPFPVITAGISIVTYSVIQVATGQKITVGGVCLIFISYVIPSVCLFMAYTYLHEFI